MNNIYIFAPANEEKGYILVQRFFQFAAGCSAARYRSWFGTRWSQVRILSPRLMYGQLLKRRLSVFYLSILIVSLTLVLRYCFVCREVWRYLAYNITMVIILD